MREGRRTWLETLPGWATLTLMLAASLETGWFQPGKTINTFTEMTYWGLFYLPICNGSIGLVDLFNSDPRSFVDFILFSLPTEGVGQILLLRSFLLQLGRFLRGFGGHESDKFPGRNSHLLAGAPTHLGNQQFVLGLLPDFSLGRFLLGCSVIPGQQERSGSLLLGFVDPVELQFNLAGGSLCDLTNGEILPRRGQAGVP